MRWRGSEAELTFGEQLILEAKAATERDISNSDLGGAVRLSDTLADAFETKGLAFAVASPEESCRSHREKVFATAIDRSAPSFEPGEIVLVAGPRLERLRAGEWTEPPRDHKL